MAALGGGGTLQPRAATPYIGRSDSAAQSSAGVQGQPRGDTKFHAAGLKGEPGGWKPVICASNLSIRSEVVEDVSLIVHSGSQPVLACDSKG